MRLALLAEAWLLPALVAPRLLVALDRLGLGRPWRHRLAPWLARAGRPVRAWRLLVAEPDAAPVAADQVAEIRVLLAAGEPVAAAAALAALAAPPTALAAEIARRLAPVSTAAPVSPVSPAATRAGDWSDLLPPRRAALRVPGALAAALARRRRYRALLWWTRRPGRRDPWREAEALLVLDRFDEARALVTRAGTPPDLRLRVLSEVLLRAGDSAGFAALVAQAVTTRFHRAHARSPLAWLLAHLRDQPDPARLFPPALAERIVALAGRCDRPAIERGLAEVLDTGFARRLRQLCSAPPPPPLAPAAERALLMQWGRDPAAGAAARGRAAALGCLGAVPPDWPAVAVLVDACLAGGDVAAAESLALAFVDRRLRVARAVTLAELEGLAARLPALPPLVDALVHLADAAGHTAIAAHARAWRARLASADWAALPASQRGRTCWVVGNGPSLASLPLAALAGDDIICVNRGHAATALGLPPPRYLVVSDPLVYADYKPAIDAAPVERLFLNGSACLARPVGLPTGVVPFGLSGLRLARTPLDFAPWVFHRGGSVVTVAIEIAAVLGYTDIRLIGVDLDYSRPDTHFYGGTARDRERLAAFRPGGGGAGIVNAALANLAPALAARGARLVNRGPAANLPALPHDPL